MDNLKELSLLGIKRNSPQGTNDGACDELINLRPKDNAWRAVGPKEIMYSDPDYDLIRIHKQDNIENWIGYKESLKTVYYYNPSSLVVTQTVVVLTASETLNEIRFLKRFMLIITTKKIYKFLYEDSAYNQVDLTGIENYFDIELETEYIEEVTSSEIAGVDNPEEFYAKYVKMVNELSDDSRLIGGIYTRYALRLFDGSYILHSAPKFHQFGDYTAYIKRTGYEQFRWIFNKNGDQAEIQLTGTSGTALITTNTEDGQESKVITFSSTLELTASSFYASNASDYASNWHIVLAPDGSKLIISTTSNTSQATPIIENLTGNLSGTIECESGANKLLATAVFDDSSTITLFEDLKDIVESIVLFSSQNQQFWDVNEDDITDYPYLVPTEESTLELKEFLNIAKEFKDDMHDSIAWYKIGEIQMNQLEFDSGTRFEKEIEIDLEGFYQNYATRETLPLDNFSHHNLTGNASYIYNDRLTLGDTLQTLANPFIKSFLPAVNPQISNRIPLLPGVKEYTAGADVNIKIQITIETTDGKKIVEQDLTVTEYYQTGGVGVSSLNKAIFFPNLISYPDSRAKEIVFFIENGGWYELSRSNMTKSQFGNFSYILRDQDNSYQFNKEDVASSLTDPRTVDTNFNSYFMQYFYSMLTPGTPETVSDEVTDSNRVQFSEANNPFVFPAENSNQISTGAIRAFGTNTEALGVSQFGQYPIIIFTSVGRWIMEIGTGEVYILSIKPLDGEVIRDNYSKLDLAFGVAYITAEGLKIASGKEVIEISENVEGLQDTVFSDNLDFQYFINLENTVQMPSYVDKIRFLTYLTGASIGYNKGNDTNEIIVANPSYHYAYIYDLDHKTWSKITDKYRLFIPNYPELYAVRTKISGLSATETNNVVNISSETSGSTQIMIVSRAICFDNPDRFKKLRRTFLRCFMNGGADKYPAMYIFKSDDLVNWTYVTGNDHNQGAFKDIAVTHSRNSARFYIFVVTGDLAVSDSVLNRINKIETEYELKMQGKLR